MSYIPINKAKSLKAINCRRFMGLNRQEYSSLGEFADTVNLSSAAYPYLSVAEAKTLSDKYSKIIDGEREITAKNIRAAIAPQEDSGVTGFCGVIGTDFYYDGKKKPLYQDEVKDSSGNVLYGMKIPSDGKIQLLWVNKIILIHGYDSSEVKPFIYYYDTALNSGDSDDCVASYEYTHKGDYGEVANGTAGNISVTFSVQRRDNAKYEACYDFNVGDSVFVDGIMTYSDSRWEKRSKLDVVSATVKSYTETKGSYSQGLWTWNITLELDLKNYLGETANVDFYDKRVYHIYKKIPYMTHLALHGGRLWGASPNGEYVYASALNEVFDFNRFDGLNDDSVYIEVSTEGGHMGVIECKNCVAVMKKNSFCAIYGELPNEFAVGKSYDGIGCIDIDSCSVINDTVYFLGSDGFYAWTGARPAMISEPLNKKYLSACGYTDGKKYYVCAYDGKTYENLVYDTKHMLWHKTDDEHITGGFKKDGKVYAVSDDGICTENGAGEEWSAESGKIFYEDFDMDRVNEMWIYLKAEENGELEVFSSSDGGNMKSEEKIKIGVTEGRIIRIPIRTKEGMYWQYKLKGKGKMVIFGIKIVYEKSGRSYSNERSGDV